MYAPEVDPDVFQQVLEVMHPFRLSMEDYMDIKNALLAALRSGLKLRRRDKSSVKMYPSYVTKMPTGEECGQYLALDLGGTNFRVCLVTLSGKKEPPIVEQRTHAIPVDKMRGTGAELFDYLAANIHEFLRLRGLLDKEFKLGFTYSFPCEQAGLNTSFHVRWTKGFSASGVVGRNVADLLQNSIDKTASADFPISLILGANVKCVAVVNDTVGTLAACSLEDKRCAVGLIVGTGSNAAYLEDIDKVELITARRLSGELTEEVADATSVVINMEWGAFGDYGELDYYRTEFDEILDKESIVPGKQKFEKMCSGMYLGEIVRLILLDLIEKGLLFQGQVPERLRSKDNFHTKYITETERDPPHLLYSTLYMLTEDLLVPTVTPQDSRIVRYVCEVVASRAAHLTGAGIAAVLEHIKRPEVSIGIDGSLYKLHPRFRERMTDILDKLLPPTIHFRLRLSEDGSGKGAAAIAAVFAGYF
uniref:Phosphotransferase n=1 Tax=Echinococcus granulosus TaxID=6210 RepID=A0A068X0X7_ECHGR|nr:hexokinase [Echinococcus granulosus]